MSVILALDLGTQTGWALIHNDDQVTSGTVSFTARPGEGPGMRYVRFRRWLNEIKSAHGQIDEVFYEDVRRHIGTTAAHVYGGLLAVLMMFCEHHGITYRGTGVGIIKKSATGNGAAKKQQMIDAAKLLGYSPMDSNEADAIHLLNYALKDRE